MSCQPSSGSSNAVDSTNESPAESSLPSYATPGESPESPPSSESPDSPASSGVLVVSPVASSVFEESSRDNPDEDDGDAFPWVAVATVSVAVALLLVIVLLGAVAVAARLYMHRLRRHTILQEFQREMVTYAGDDLTTSES